MTFTAYWNSVKLKFKKSSIPIMYDVYGILALFDRIVLFF